ncbi:hypothetical protein OPV22_023386 [Ensete ventricosum]|uniref:DUF676 domain-containing protein n=1 Tax=Ensete ventricosum TaxID=4639 RepID=A0AAV8QHV7_ENSVE|nr:hypothetical protein OPV22_023386 [Ensete ventricosum]
MAPAVMSRHPIRTRHEARSRSIHRDDHPRYKFHCGRSMTRGVAPSAFRFPWDSLLLPYFLRTDHIHGIGASSSDWTYSKAVLKKRLGSNFLIYASSCNSYIKTFDGIDIAGRRLADEVLSVIRKTGSLKKISFTAHSLGGLIARYTISVLYSSDALHKDLNDGYKTGNPENLESSSKLGSIGGLEPISFITLGTPHLGFIGKKQFPLLLGSPILEKLVPPVAAIFVGRTGSQLFLTDDEPNNPPLLLRMTSDSEDLKFLSSLAAFRIRILYANVSYDHLVGWRTSSIRREDELAKPCRQSVDGYMHVVNVEYCPPVLSEGPRFPSEAATAKAAAQTASNTQKTAEYYTSMEEEMIRSLQRVGWRKVDVSFHAATWPFFAHNNLHVKRAWLNGAGAGVIAHVADSLKQQEVSRTLIAANL